MVDNTTKNRGSCHENGEAPQIQSIVISGLSGRFPESSNVEEFAENLFGGVDMITENGRRWAPGYLGLPTRSGKLKELDKFDADYFSIHAKQGDFMDPQLRMLLEVAHEAILDAGVNPQEIRGQNVGVFIGASASESETQWNNDTTITHGYSTTGCHRGMFSNRISFAFDFKGPSLTIDTACSSSLMALEQAFSALQLGHCDSAIVGGANLCLEPRVAQQFQKLNMLSPQGKCQSFDASGDGYVRSEAVVAIFLQRKNVARRFYASILAVKTNTDGHKKEGVTFPSGKMQKALLQKTYKDAGIDPKDVVYIEAHGTGTPAGDPQELNAIADVFCRDRNPNKPLLIGSVKSNMGHSEPASGLCGIAKVLLAMQRGMIPANLHYETPNPNIPALKTGELKVVSKNLEWNGGIVGINSFGFGGANVHAILQSNPKLFLEENEEASLEIPHIIPFSGRTKESVELVLRELSSRKSSRGQLQLLHKIHSKNIPGHHIRGFAVVSKYPKKTEISVEEIQTQSEPPAVWFIFNGMGSQWAGMGKGLMKFQRCKESLEKLAVILKAKHIDLVDILTNGKEDTFENVLNSFVSIAAIQIALIDLLSSLNIKPDGIIGHSIGELGAAYADNCLTAEQVILTAHARGQAILDLGPGDGAMAAIGLSWEEALKKCPEGIYPACHNSKNSVTVSGPANLINNFIEQLSKEEIFARHVNSSNQAFHSKYIEPAKLKFKQSLDEIIPVPVPRSNRWMSSSVPESEWSSNLAETSSADYHVNNMISPVLFQEAMEKIPESAVVIEIGPHCLLQAILKRSLPNCSQIGLLNKNHKDNTIFLCSSIGKMFNFGLNPSLSNLYPEIQFPVPLQTPPLSSVVSKCWDHSKSWNVPSFSSSKNLKNISDSNKSGSFEISLDNEDDAFYSGHKINGSVIFPQSGLIFLVWKSWAEIHQLPFEELPCVLENLVVSKVTKIPKKCEASLKISIIIIKSTGEFRIEEKEDLIASGTIRSQASDDFIPVDPIQIPTPGENTEEILLNQQDFYKYMRLRGYEYSGDFQGVKRVNFEKGWAEVEFSNWVTFLDSFLQPHVGHLCLERKDKSVLLPAYLKKLFIDPQKFVQNLCPSTKQEKSAVLVTYKPAMKLISCEGVQIHGQLKYREITFKNQQELLLHKMETFEFTPYFDTEISEISLKNTEDHCLRVCVGLVLENLQRDELNIAEIQEDNQEKLISPSVKEFCEGQPKKTCEAVAVLSDLDMENKNHGKDLKSLGITISHVNSTSENLNRKNLIILHNFKKLKDILQNLVIGNFVLLRVANSAVENRREIESIDDLSVVVVSRKISKDSVLYLFRKIQNSERIEKMPVPSVNINVTMDTSKNYGWVENLKMEMKLATKDKIEQGFRINVISKSFNSGQFVPSGILGLINSLRREPGGHALRCYFINDPDSPVFDFQQPDQELENIIQRDLLMNVYQNGVWGSYRFFPLPPETSKQVEHAYLNFQKRGDLSSFQWFESPLKYSNEEMCSVYYSALDLPTNLGNQDCVFGMEFSGVDSKGKRVMGILPAKAMATSVTADPGILWNVPQIWSLAEAATVPVAYATAYYALIVRGRLNEGESILIHDGAGSTGLAALSIALNKNCRVFTTVGSMEEREFLKNNFMQLDDSSFANSKDTSFLQHIMNKTNGHGMDLVLNSLAGDKLMASIECTAQHGRFLQLGKVDLYKDTKLGMSLFLKGVNFSEILMDFLTSESPTKQELWKLIDSGIESRVVQPLKHDVFSDSLDDIEQAFRFMTRGKHLGKLLIQLRNEHEKPEDKIIQALPRTYFDPSKSYIILGGLGGFGLELCDWMIQRGATKLLLISRSGLTNGYQKLCLNRWAKSGKISVLISTEDATTFEGATEILKKAIEYFHGAPIGGIFNLAMVLRDGLFENQTPENFEAVAKPKINASMAMDKASRILTPELEYFVCFSSIVSGRGAPGLSNYAYANSALERICEMRKQEGFPALTIQWAGIGDVGVMVDKFNLGDDDAIEGTAPQKISSCLNTLDIFLQSSVEFKGESCSTLSSLILAPKLDANANQMVKKNAAANGSKRNWVESIARILGIKVEELEKNPNKSFNSFGMDSLMMTEMKQFIEFVRGPSSDVSDLKSLSLTQLLEMMPKESTSETKVHQEEKATNTNDNKTNSLSSSSAVSKEAQALTSLASPANIQLEHRENAEIQNKTSILSSSSTATFLVEIFRQVVAHLLGIVLLTILCLILYPLSVVLRLFFNFYLRLFYDTTKIKLVDGVGEPMYIAENVNSVHILKFSGVPKREDIVKRLEERLCNLQCNIQYFDSDSNSNSNILATNTTQTTEEFYEPFERLKWSIKKGLLFDYWIKDDNFEVSRHIVFEGAHHMDLDLDLESEMPRLAKYYHTLEWDEPAGSSSSSSRPWWEIRIVTSQKSQEFLVVLVWNHAYGDGRSFINFLQYGFADVTPPLSQQKTMKNEDGADLPSKISAVNESFQNIMLKQCSHFLAKTRQTLHKAHLLIEFTADLLLKTWDTRNANFAAQEDTHAASAFGKFPLSTLKSLKDPETGKTFNLNTIVLAICARACGRILKGVNETDDRQISHLFPAVAWSPFHNQRLNLVNNMVMMPVSVPVTFGATFDMDMKTKLLETLKTTEENWATAGQMENLLVAKDIAIKLSAIPYPLVRPVLSGSLRSSFLFSNILAVVPKATTFFNGQSLKDIYGFTAPCPISVIVFTDSINDSLTVTCTIGETIFNDISPEFHQLFFTYFEQEMNNVQNSCTLH